MNIPGALQSKEEAIGLLRRFADGIESGRYQLREGSYGITGPDAETLSFVFWDLDRIRAAEALHDAEMSR